MDWIPSPSNQIIFVGSNSQLWKLDDKILENKEGVWKSADLWIVKYKDDDDGLFYVENTSKSKVLTAANNHQVILEDFEEDKAEQLWKVGETDAEG